MKTVYRYIRFHKSTTGDPKPNWSCDNKGEDYSLGTCAYYSGWKEYVFAPNFNTEYSASCLDDISDFLKQLNGGAK